MDFTHLNEAFRKAGRTLGSVESLTGGLFAARVTDIPGASHFYKGGFVTYFTEEKVRLLGISYDDIDKYGVVSSEIASKMAINGAARLAVDYCISFTGNAGPSTMENKPVGTVFIGVHCYGKVNVAELSCKGTREEIREQCLEYASNFLLKLLEENH